MLWGHWIWTVSGTALWLREICIVLMGQMMGKDGCAVSTEVCGTEQTGVLSLLSLSDRSPVPCSVVCMVLILNMQLQMHRRKREGNVGFASADVKVASLSLTGEQVKTGPRREESKLMGKYNCSMNSHCCGFTNASRNVLVEHLCCTSQEFGTSYPSELILRPLFQTAIPAMGRKLHEKF